VALKVRRPISDDPVVCGGPAVERSLLDGLDILLREERGKNVRTRTTS
jgi:hypothetical protein